MRLEKRRVLSADFSFIGGGLILDGFDSPDGDSLAITQDFDEYRFTTDSGWQTSGPTPDGVSVEGDTLSIDRGILESLTGGLAVVDGDSTPLSVSLGQADFSGLGGPISLLAPSTLSQQPQTTFTTPDDGLQVAAATSGLTLTSMSVAGDLEVTAFGEITDEPGTQVFVTGNARFVTLDGNATGGITLADDPGDRLIVRGDVTFDALDPADGPWNIDVGSQGRAEFGNITALGGSITLRESGPTTLENVQATEFNLISAGVIDTTPGATINVTGDATLVSNATRFSSDLDNSGVVDQADYDLWAADYGNLADATNPEPIGDINRDGSVDAADYTVWRDQLTATPADGGIDITVADQFVVGGLARLAAGPGDGSVDPTVVAAADRYDITVGEDVDARFGSFAAIGKTVFIAEDADPVPSATATTVIDGVDAETLAILSDGLISDAPTAVITTTQDASFVSTGGVLLANEGADNRVTIGGVATFVVEGDGGGISVGGVAPGGAQADAFFSSNQLRFASTDSAANIPIDIRDDVRIEIATWVGAAVPGRGGTTLAISGNNAGRLDLYAAETISSASIPEGTSVDAVDATLVAEDSIFLADVAADRFVVTGLLTAVSRTNDVNFGIDPVERDTGAFFDAVRLRFSAADQARFVDQLGVSIAAWTGSLPTLGTSTPTTNDAARLSLVVSDGEISDESAATVNIRGEAIMVASEGVTLADGGNGNTVTVGGVTSVLVPVSDPTIAAPIALGTDPSVGGSPTTATFNTGKLRYNAIGQDVFVAESSATVFAGWAGVTLPDFATPTANLSQTLSLTSFGSITDDPGVVIDVTDNATLTAVGSIVLADQDDAANELNIGGLGVFTVTPDGGRIALGVDPASDAPVGSQTLIGRMALVAVGGDVDAALDSDATFDLDSRAQTLNVTAAGDILDGTAATGDAVRVLVTGDAGFTAGGDILLADAATAANTLDIDGNARFEVAAGRSIDVGIRVAGSRLAGDIITGAASSTELGSLTFVAPMGGVRVAQDNPATLAGVSTAGAASLLSADSVTNAEDAILDVTGDAWFGAVNDTVTAVGPITLGGQTGDRITLGSLAMIADSAFITEDTFAGDATPGTLLKDISLSGISGFELTTAGPITDAVNAAVLVMGEIDFNAIGSITLADADNVNNMFLARDAANFTVMPDGGTIDIGVDPTTGAPAAARAELATMSLRAVNGVARVALDDNATFDAVTQVGTLEVQSAGSILDADGSLQPAEVRVTGDATFIATDDIRLADADRASNVLDIDGLGSFTVGMGRDLDLGVVTSTGLPADSLTTIERLTFTAPDGDVRIALDNVITLQGMIDARTLSLNSVGDIFDEPGTTIRITGATDLTARTPAGDRRQIILGDNPTDVTSFGSLELIGSIINIQEDNLSTDASPGTLLTGVLADRLTLTADGPITDSGTAIISVLGDAELTSGGDITLADDNTAGTTNSLVVAGNARFVVANGQDIDVGIQGDGSPAAANYMAGSLSFSATAGNVRIAEDDGLELADDSNAAIVCLHSAGDITDGPSATLNVTGDALFDATGSIVLADDNTAATTNSLVVGDHARFAVASGQNIDVGVQPDGNPALANFQAGTLSFSAAAGTVRIAEDDGLALAGGSDAQTLRLRSEGSITDVFLTSFKGNPIAAPLAAVVITGDALFDAEGSITLADNNTVGTTNSLVVTGNSRFVVANGQNIGVGVQADGSPAAANFMAGTLSFNATDGTVRIAEDDGLELTDTSDAATVRLRSAGAITDTSIAVLNVAGDAFFNADAGITLADDNEANTANSLEIDGAASFTVANGQNVDVGVRADGTSDGGEPALANFQSNTIAFSAADGTVRIAEDDGLEIAGIGFAETVRLRSAGAITDADLLTGTILEATGDATLVAQTTITLADTDDGDNVVAVGGVARFESLSGGDIRVGVDAGGVDRDAFTRFGSLTFVSGDGVLGGTDGIVTIHEDSSEGDPSMVDPLTEGVLLTADSSAGDLVLSTDWAVRDDAGATVTLARDGLINAQTGITLADDNTAATNNSLVVEANVRFEVGDSRNIDVGVQADGTPALANFQAGTLSFSAPNGVVRIAEDADTLLAAMNVADDLELSAAGSINDLNIVTNGAAAASTTIQQTAILSAGTGGSDVILGDETAFFSMGSPQLFSRQQFLQVTARDVSIQADSGVNVRAGDGSTSRSSGVRGVFHLTAEGSITQVHSSPTQTNRFSAERVALTATDSVYFDSLTLTAQDSETPNLQVQAGTALRLADDVDGSDSDGRYHRNSIPDDANDPFAPVVVSIDSDQGDRDPQPPRPRTVDGMEVATPLEDVRETPDTFAQLDERNAPASEDTVSYVNDIQDDYAAVIQVIGSAVVGDVADATGAYTESDTQASRGLVVAGTGNAYLDTTDSLTFSGVGRFGSQGDGGGGQREATVVELAGGVFTAIAGTTLAITTDDPDQDGSVATVARTTKLKSATGTVTALSDPPQTGEDIERGPRVVVDAASNNAAASTTGIVRAENDFEQRITVALGSRGEDNLLVEVEWADVADVREDSNLQPVETGSRRVDFDDLPQVTLPVPGSQPVADLIQTPQGDIEDATLEDGLIYNNASDNGFRVVTIRHNYSEEFIPVNRAEINRSNNQLPTTVRVFNDPAINLFENGAGEEGEEVRDLNSAAFDLAPQIITQQGGFFILSTPDRPSEYIAPEVIAIRSDAVTAAQRTLGDDGRAAVVSSAETVVYGRVDPSGENEGEWMTGIPGEEWPQFDDDAEGDFLREIRQQIDQGPYSEGRYQIRISTPRGEQLLEEWTKGDLNAEETLTEPEATAEEAQLPEAAEAVPAEAEEAPVIAPLAPRVSAVEGRADADAEATQAAFAAMAAVGAWRQRLGERGRFTLDSDGVGFTRTNRRRRKPRS